MNDILKQRLVGALVLIALGVIFWPVVFVESERGGLDRNPQVTPMPVLEDAAIPAPQPLEDVEPVNQQRHAVIPESEGAEQVEESATPEEPESQDETEQGTETASAAPSGSDEVQPKLDEQGIPIAWVLQVATVSSREKAEALTAELIGKGYKAYHRSTRRDGQLLFRVFVGPVFERAKLAVAKREIDQQFAVSAIIARYVP